MNAMNEKKLYIWNLAKFLSDHGKVMSGAELAEHLNRNKFLTGYGAEFRGTRGTYRLIKATYEWVSGDLGLPSEAGPIAKAFVDADGGYAYLK